MSVQVEICQFGIWETSSYIPDLERDRYFFWNTQRSASIVRLSGKYWLVLSEAEIVRHDVMLPKSVSLKGAVRRARRWVAHGRLPFEVEEKLRRECDALLAELDDMMPRIRVMAAIEAELSLGL